MRKLSDINTSKSQIEFTHSMHCSQQEFNYDIFKLDRQHIYVFTRKETIVKQRFFIRIKLWDTHHISQWNERFIYSRMRLQHRICTCSQRIVRVSDYIIENASRVAHEVWRELLSNRWRISRMSSNIKWVRSEEEFSINRRRNRKSNTTSISKEIFIKYAEKTNHKKNEKIIVMKIIRENIIQSQRTKDEIKLSNDVTIYENKDVVNKFLSIVMKFNIWKKHDTSVVISSKNHMSITLKFDWADKIKSNKIYSLRSKERIIVNEIFDNLHDKEKMKWFTNFTSFEYSIFVIYRTVMKDDKLTRKDRAIIDIKELNAIIMIDVYFMSAQTNIIVAIAECLYIFVMNVLKYFYQWTVKFDDRHKLTIIFHRKQKQFNVCVMNYKNSSSYVQR